MSRSSPLLTFLMTFALLAAAATTTGCGRANGAGAPGDDARGSGSGSGSAAKPSRPGGGPPGRPGGPPSGEREAVPVRVESLERRDIASVYRSSTTLRAARSAPVVARAAGIVRKILVEEGDRVSAGQLMALLEDDQARLELQQARVDLEIAEQEFERAERLRAENLVSVEEYEQKRNAEAQARTRVELAELTLAFTRLTAPFGGTVTRRYVDSGATVSSGETVFDLVDVSRFYADVAVPESVAARLEVGGPAQLIPTALGTELPATIERLSPAVDPQTGTVKVTLVAAAIPGLRSGGFVDVRITTDLHEDALVTKPEALVAEGEGWLVYTVVDGRSTRVPVRTGFEDDTGVEIVPTGEGPAIDAGVDIVVGGVAAIADGTPVRIDRPEQPEASDEERAAGNPVARAGS